MAVLASAVSALSRASSDLLCRGGRPVDFKEPDIEGVVEEKVKAKELEAFVAMPCRVQLHCLRMEGNGSQRHSQSGPRPGDKAVNHTSRMA